MTGRGKCYKYCIVPKCKNTTLKTPNKLFFLVPKNTMLRAKWCRNMHRNDLVPLSSSTSLYCCEDHFNVEEDMQNYLQYKMIGGLLKLKNGVIPHKFCCQKETNEILPKRRTRRKKYFGKVLSKDVHTSFSTEETEFVDCGHIACVAENVMTLPSDVICPDVRIKQEPPEENTITIEVPPIPATEKMEQSALKSSPDDDIKDSQVKSDTVEINQNEENVNNVTIKKECQDLNVVENNEEKETNSNNISLDEIKCEMDRNEDVSKYTDLEPMEQDYEENSEKNILFCKLCPFSSEDITKYDNHADAHKGLRLYECNMCTHTCKRIYDFKLHRMTHEGLKFACSKCSYVGSTPKNLRKHETRHFRTEKSFFCDECDYACRYYHNLKIHKLTHSQEKPYSCELCEYTCRTSGNLRSHQVKHTNERNFFCKLCNYSCKQSRTLKIHSMSHTDAKQYLCEECDYACYFPKQMKKHMAVHSPEKKYPCSECSYASKTVGNLKIHKLGHTDSRPFECNICNYTCKMASLLKKHMLSHSDDRPFRCDECSYTCKRARNLKSHKIRHLQDKPYACPQCDYTSKRLDNVRTHKLTHTTAKPFSCDHCSFSCNRMDNLKIHILMHSRKTEESP